MGMGLIGGAISLIGGLVIASLMSKSTDDDDRKPASIDSFGATLAQEGSVIPWVRGKVRIPGNILWYGNLTTSEESQEVGGKGLMGASGGATVGYHYYLDVWQSICMGPNVALEKAYINDVEKSTSDLGTYTLNSGNDGTYPTEAGVYANAIPGVAHIFFPDYYIGLNVTQLPVIHFVVNVTSDAPLTYVNESNGVNPAAVIYDILRDSGVPASQIDTAAFNSASTVWHNLGYGINIAIKEQSEVAEAINHVFNYVDGALTYDENDNYTLKAFAAGESSTASLPEADFGEFTYDRRTYASCYTDFKATYLDEDQDFTDRTVKDRNPAVAKLLGYDLPKSIDLRAFVDADSASKRLSEIMEKMSYPEGQIDCALPIKYTDINVGDVVDMTHSLYNLSADNYRCMRKEIGGEDVNKVSMRFVQVLEDVASTNYLTGAGSQWTTPSYAPAALSQQRVFELPYNTKTGELPAYLLLAARAGAETSFAAKVSFTGSDYTTQGEYTTFSQRGTLAEEYASNTYSIDQDAGILYTPSRDDPTFSTISRTELFSTSRIAIIESEMIAFQTITPEGANSYRLTGCIRGLLNTTIATHANGTEIWITTIQNNILQGLAATDFYLKLLPSFRSQQLALASASAIHVQASAKGLTPWPPMRVKVVKSGATNTVTVWPTPRLYEGAGARDADAQTDKENPDYSGTFDWYTNLDPTINSETDRTFTVTQAGALIIYVRHNVSGYASGYQATTISAGDATYIGPDI